MVTHHKWYHMVHVMETLHNIKWKESGVMMRKTQLTKRNLKETLLIKITQNSVKLDKGLQLDNRMHVN